MKNENHPHDAHTCAHLLLETMPGVMMRIGEAVRQHKFDDELLSMGQLRMLRILSAAPRKLGELAALHHVTPSTMSRAVDVLVRRAWINRETDPNDRRMVILSLTDEGSKVQQALHEHTQEVFAEAMTELIERLDDGERERLYDGLTVLRTLLEMSPTGQFGCPAGAHRSRQNDATHAAAPEEKRHGEPHNEFAPRNV